MSELHSPHDLLYPLLHALAALPPASPDAPLFRSRRTRQPGRREAQRPVPRRAGDREIGEAGHPTAVGGCGECPAERPAAGRDRRRHGHLGLAHRVADRKRTCLNSIHRTTYYTHCCMLWLRCLPPPPTRRSSDLVALVSPVAEKLSVRSPAVPVIARLVKLATPLPLVVAVSVPPSVPPPVAIAAVTVTWAWLTALQIGSAHV